MKLEDKRTGCIHCRIRFLFSSVGRDKCQKVVFVRYLSDEEKSLILFFIMDFFFSRQGNEKNTLKNVFLSCERHSMLHVENLGNTGKHKE